MGGGSVTSGSGASGSVAAPVASPAPLASGAGGDKAAPTALVAAEKKLLAEEGDVGNGSGDAAASGSWYSNPLVWGGVLAAVAVGAALLLRKRR